jgi:hypothetical protein
MDCSTMFRRYLHLLMAPVLVTALALAIAAPVRAGKTTILDELHVTRGGEALLAAV